MLYTLFFGINVCGLDAVKPPTQFNKTPTLLLWVFIIRPIQVAAGLVGKILSFPGLSA